MSSGKELETRQSNVPRRQEGKRNDGTLIMEDARIVFRNFAGVEGQYNREGDRNFCVLLEDDLAEDMLDDGWNVKRLKPREGEERGTAYIQVSLGWKILPPRLVIINSKGRIDLCERDPETGKHREDEAVLLDWADMDVVDLIIRPYRWNVQGKTGIKAYLKSIFVIIREDYLELKYADVPMAKLETSRPIHVESARPSDGQHFDEGEMDEDIVDAELVDD